MDNFGDDIDKMLEGQAGQYVIIIFISKIKCLITCKKNLVLFV